MCPSEPYPPISSQNPHEGRGVITVRAFSSGQTHAPSPVFAEPIATPPPAGQHRQSQLERVTSMKQNEIVQAEFQQHFHRLPFPVLSSTGVFHPLPSSCEGRGGSSSRRLPLARHQQASLCLPLRSMRNAPPGSTLSVSSSSPRWPLLPPSNKSQADPGTRRQGPAPAIQA